MAGEPLEVNFDRWGEKNIKRILGRFGFQARRDLDDVLSFLNDAFGEQKSRRQLAILSRRAHGHSDAAPAYADFQGFFPRQRIGAPCRFHA